jgi:hypothetical protein
MVKLNKATLKKEQDLIQSYYDKIEELKNKQKERENQFFIKIGKLVMSKLDNDIDEAEAFSEWLDVYLESKQNDDDKSSEKEVESDGN